MIKKTNRNHITVDGNEAAAHIAYKVNEVIAIYPITPASAMGEYSDEWSSKGKKNIWGSVPLVQEMQSEGGAAGTVHGALQTGALTTTFTSSQGLLLMIPNMYKIAGELTSAVFHVAARSLASQALSIFCDHSDVMAARATGFSLFSSGSVQEAMDFALISHAVTLESRIPILHFFDGFRTSHEISKVEELTDDDIKHMIDEQLVQAHRSRGLTPDRPVVRGTSQNPDVYFQARESVEPYYKKSFEIYQRAMDKFAKLTGRQYHLYDYYGEPDAQRIIVIMGSGAQAAMETVDYLNRKGEKLGVLIVRLFRPFSVEHFIGAIPKTVKAIAVLDRTKEPGSSGEPLYLDVINALHEMSGKKHFTTSPNVIGGRYGLSSKEFTPAMIKGIYNELNKKGPKNHFTIGINDDLSHSSLEYDEEFITESTEGVRAIFYGLGSDGTVGANKNTIKIIGENTENFVQAYFVYDSRKSGAMTVSHLRFGKKPIKSTYLVSRANFIGCHQFSFLERYDVLSRADQNGVFLLNSYYGPDQVWEKLPNNIQRIIIEKNLKLYVIDAYIVARNANLGGKINTIMQTCFFAISGILPREQAIETIKGSIEKAYKKKGEKIVKMNFDAVDHTLKNLHEVKVPALADGIIEKKLTVSRMAPDFVQQVTSKMIAQCGDRIPVSAMPDDGTYPVGTSKWEKRNISQEIPVWEEDMCIQCGKCVLICPHSVIRTKIYEEEFLKARPRTFKTMKMKDRELNHLNYTIQVSPEDCTGCKLCVDVCPVKDKDDPSLKSINMHPIEKLKDQEIENWEYFLKLPLISRDKVKHATVRGVQALEPLFEFSGACAACGETPYIKLMTQLFGDRAVIANATGCSSIYGGNLPTSPWTTNEEGRGPAWSNSLFEDNAEFGLGFRLSINKQKEYASELLKKVDSQVGATLVKEILEARQLDEAEIYEQRERIAVLKEKLKKLSPSSDVKRLLGLADMLVKKSVWIVGGDGWAYDIGFGGLDHVLSLDKDVNILVLDTEVYSNTGGQASKATPRAAVAKFAAGGKKSAKKDLARLAINYGHVYVANVDVGAKDEQTVRAFIEAERHDGPSIIIAYSHCIAHGINMAKAIDGDKAAVLSGYWPLFRYNPELVKQGKNPMILDSSAPKIEFEEFIYRENRYKSLVQTDPEEAKRLLELARHDAHERWAYYDSLSKNHIGLRQE